MLKENLIGWISARHTKRSNYTMEYRNSNAVANDLVSVNIVSYKLTKNIEVGSSAANMAGLGWIPSPGFQLGGRKPAWALIFNPAISINIIMVQPKRKTKLRTFFTHYTVNLNSIYCYIQLYL
jgi:hypothetical protein